MYHYTFYNKFRIDFSILGIIYYCIRNYSKDSLNIMHLLSYIISMGLESESNLLKCFGSIFHEAEVKMSTGDVPS